MQGRGGKTAMQGRRGKTAMQRRAQFYWHLRRRVNILEYDEAEWGLNSVPPGI